MCKKGTMSYVLLQDLVVFECFTKLNETELQSSKLFQTDMDCTQTAQKIQTPLHVHLEVALICTFLAYGILRITGNFPYNLYSSFNTFVVVHL